MSLYVDYAYYINTYHGTLLTPQDAPRAFERASNAVDTLTLSRITERGFEALTAFQKDIVQRVVCALADWQTENADWLDASLSSYGINGVSVSFGAGTSVRTVGGVMIPSHLYADLIKTGLCYRGV